MTVLQAPSTKSIFDGIDVDVVIKGVVDIGTITIDNDLLMSLTKTTRGTILTMLIEKGRV